MVALKRMGRRMEWSQDDVYLCDFWTELELGSEEGTEAEEEEDGKRKDDWRGRLDRKREEETRQREGRRQCEFVMERKDGSTRRCRFTPRKGSAFCGDHVPTEERVQCQACGTKVRELQKHWRKCPTRRRSVHAEMQPYFVAGCNRGSSPHRTLLSDSSSTPRRSPAQLIGAVAQLFERLPDELRNPPQSFRRASGCEAVIRAEEIWKAGGRHSVQQSAILGHLESHRLLPHQSLARDSRQSSRVYVEFGCGRGYLSLLLADAGRGREDVMPFALVLVDRESPRNKADRELRKRSGVDLERVRIDLADLALDQVQSVQRSRRMVGLGKHLCGEATDFTLRGAMRCTDRRDSSGVGTDTDATIEDGVRCEGVFIAPCCRHRCDPKTFLNMEFFEEKGIAPDEFNAIRTMSSWALSAGKKGFGNRDSCSAHKSHPVASDVDIRAQESLHMSYQERCNIGVKCRRLIDAARVLKLREMGFDARVVLYVEPSVTPENVLLVVRTCK